MEEEKSKYIIAKFAVTEETVGRLKTAMEIKVITRYNKT